MEKSEKILKIKNGLKNDGKEIRTLKNAIKILMKGGNPCWREQGKLFQQKLEFRHKHIAYCLLKGRTLEEIERTVHEGNEPNQQLIDKYIGEFTND